MKVRKAAVEVNKMLNKIALFCLTFNPLHVTTNAFLNIPRNYASIPHIPTKLVLSTDRNYTRSNNNTNTQSSSSSSLPNVTTTTSETLNNNFSDLIVTDVNRIRDIKQSTQDITSEDANKSASLNEGIPTNNNLTNDTVLTSTSESVEVAKNVSSVETSPAPPSAHDSSSVISSSSSSSTLVAETNAHLQLIDTLKTKYKNKFIYASIPQFPFCEIYLCGTLHVAKTSSDMVADIIRTMKPHYVILEICETRADSLYELDPPNITLSDVIKECFQQKSVKVLGMGLLSWMQLKSAKILG